MLRHLIELVDWLSPLRALVGVLMSLVEKMPVFKKLLATRTLTRTEIQKLRALLNRSKAFDKAAFKSPHERSVKARGIASDAQHLLQHDRAAKREIARLDIAKWQLSEVDLDSQVVLDDITSIQGIIEEAMGRSGVQQ